MTKDDKKNPLNVLVIDEHAEFRELIGHHITSEWPDARLTLHDPNAQGPMPDHFSGAGYDLVFLDYDLGERYTLEEENGLTWLRAFKRRPDFPPVLLITGKGDELLAVEAMKTGADDYIPKRMVSHELLIHAAKEALRNRRRTTALLRRAEEKHAESSILRVKGYRILKVLARRGVSSVYVARSEKRKQRVVLKVLRQLGDARDGKSALERFIQEYEVISKIDHPNVVKIFAHGIADDHAYIAMEYFKWGDLKARMRKRITAHEALRYVEQVAAALQVIHSVGVLHRDLKPANVMIREDGTLVLIDFGLAKELQLRSTLTETGEVFGTPYYMSPEQGHAEPVDARGDLYSLGVIFYELLTGKKPYVAATPLAVIYKHSHAAIPRLPAHLQAFQSLLEKMIAKDKAERFQTAEELLDAIRNFGESRVSRRA